MLDFGQYLFLDNVLTDQVYVGLSCRATWNSLTARWTGFICILSLRENWWSFCSSSLQDSQVQQSELPVLLQTIKAIPGVNNRQADSYITHNHFLMLVIVW